MKLRYLIQVTAIAALPADKLRYIKSRSGISERLNYLERITGIGPAASAWEADVLPLNYIRVRIIIHYRTRIVKRIFYYDRGQVNGASLFCPRQNR